MKPIYSCILIVAFTLLVALPAAVPFGDVSAQNSNFYSIDSVNHQVQVIYSGQVAVIDTIHVSGRVTDGFMIGLPYKFSADVQKALVYDDSHTYQVNLGVKFGEGNGFYGAEVNFNGNSPSTFTVAFILSNRLITEQTDGSLNLEYPAYPSFTQNVAACNVNLAFPTTPANLKITKADGAVDSTTYTKTNLPAYTNLLATANFRVSVGAIQLTSIDSLNRQVTLDTAGQVFVVDSYRIVNNATATLKAFVFNVPLDATNVAVKDDVGRDLPTVMGSTSDTKTANVTLTTFLVSGQATTIAIQYNLPSVTLQGPNYILGNFMLFPRLSYYVTQATITFSPPEGATIVAPTVTALDSSATLTRNVFQDTLTVKRDDISFLDYNAPEQNSIQLSYGYSPVWVSLRPTFWASLLAVVGCVAAVVVRSRRPKEEKYVPRAVERLAQSTPAGEQAAPIEYGPGQQITIENVKEFTGAYEEKKRLKTEIISLDEKAQKGKIPRRQFKVQRKAVEIRLEAVTRNIQRMKKMLRASSAVYADLVHQLDAVEADLAETEDKIRNIQARQSRGEISLETYKRNVGEYQKRKEKAESAINGILLRLREKTR